jgi:hypothetical protein
MATSDRVLLLATRAIFGAHHPDFEEENQSLEDMKFLGDWHGVDYIQMARAALEAAARKDR